MKDNETFSEKTDETEMRVLANDEPSSKLEDAEVFRSRFGPISPEDAWVPGLIEVVFKEASQSGVQGWGFPDEKERKEFSPVWSNRLKEVLRTNELVTWKPSFPLQYPWSIETDEEARKNYGASGRDRFVTFNFPKEAATLRIADELGEMPEIEQAVAVPRIAPASGPLDEPLMGTSDLLMDTVCRTDVCNPNGCLKNQWYIFRCRVNQAWEKANVSGSGVAIADIDWGFNTNHQDLRNKIKLTRNMFPNSPNLGSVANGNVLDHGTAVLALAGAEVNQRGMAGVAFGADLWAIQAGTETELDHSLWAAAIKFVGDQKFSGRKVIILEIQTILGGNIEMVLTIRKEIIDAIGRNIVVCVPAGDRGRDAGTGDDGKPIPPTDSILVGATRYHEILNIRNGTNIGSRVVIHAPGDRRFDLTACDQLNDGYRNGFGFTSGAEPKVAGAAALMLEVNSQLTHHEVRDILSQSNVPVVDDSGQQVGVLLDAEQAVCEALRRAGGSCPQD